MSDTSPTVRPSGSRLQRWRQRYATIAVVFCNTLLLYLALNLLLGIVFLFRDGRRVNPVTATYGSRLDAVYPDLPEPERTRMLDESWSRPYQYADYIHFQERPATGQYVNVSPAGFRHSIDQGPWPPESTNFNVFCFGGSTMFGYGVPDGQTVASGLQQALSQTMTRRVCVYNFGVGWHFSTQERLRFEQLLLSGHVPDVAIFLDGINDTSLAWENKPAFSPQLAAAFEHTQAFGVQSPSAGTSGSTAASLTDALIGRWPLGRAVRGLAARLNPQSSPAAAPRGAVSITPELAQRGSDVYRWNRKLITAAAREAGVTPLFVVQPAPGYHCRGEHTPFANAQLGANEAVFYEALAARLKSDEDDPHLLWLADLPQHEAGPLFVDVCHYTAKFSRTIANGIVSQMQSRGHLPPDDSGR